MKRPAFQFYPADWRNNAKLRRCSWRERGIWIEMLGLLHDSDEYGVLRWPLDEIAGAVGCQPSDLRAIQAKGVLKGAEFGEDFSGFWYTPMHGKKAGPTVCLIEPCAGPVFFSSRMVTDEHVRNVRANHGDKGAQGAQPKAAPKDEPIPPIVPPPSSTSSSSASKSTSKATSGLATNGADLFPKPDSPPKNEQRRQAEEVLAFLNAKTGRHYRPGKVNIGFILARMKEGATVRELRAVVAIKSREWRGSDDMDKYLRPATLFSSTNFAQYVGDVPPADMEATNGPAMP